MKKCTIIHHQGYGDLITNNSLCNHYSELYDEVTIFVLDEGRKSVVDYMYAHRPNIKCEIPKLHNNYNGEDSCLICMTLGSPQNCLRDYSRKCEFIDYSEYQECDNIKIGCFDKCLQWNDFYDDQYFNKNLSFSHAFYNYAELESNIRLDKFSVNRDLERENNLYNSLESKDYIVLHSDSERGLNIDMNRVSDCTSYYELTNKSNVMIDQITILENAKEIHLIDSGYSVLIYFLSFVNDKIAKIPKYLHEYVTPNRDVKIYTEPVPENWYKI